jgi:uncharacterized membrane protein YeaQ/YmgE (transglycosylase-associated protein family)
VIILAFIVIALVAGFVANWLVGRGRGYETWELFVAGLVGSFVGGIIFSLISGNFDLLNATGLVGSTIGAIVVLLIYGPLRTTLRPSLRNKPVAKNTALPPKKKNG